MPSQALSSPCVTTQHPNPGRVISSPLSGILSIATLTQQHRSSTSSLTFSKTRRRRRICSMLGIRLRTSAAATCLRTSSLCPRPLVRIMRVSPMAALSAQPAHIAGRHRDRPSERSGTALRRRPSAVRPFHLLERHFSSSSNHDHIAQLRPRHHSHQIQDRRLVSASVACARPHGPHLPLVLVPVVVPVGATTAMIQIPFPKRPRVGSHHLLHHLQHPHSQTLHSQPYRARLHPGHPQSSLRVRVNCNISLVVRRQRHLRGHPDAQHRARQ